MRNLKKFLALVLAFMMVMSLMITANAATNSEDLNFSDSDIITAEFLEDIQVLTGMDVIQGLPGGSFGAQNEINRGQMAAIIYRITTGDVTDSRADYWIGYNRFPDVHDDDYYAGYIGYCASAGYIAGFPDGTFKPMNKVTGYQALAMILRAMGYNHEGDNFTGNDWQSQVSSRAKSNNMLASIEKTIYNNTFGKAATRELVAEMTFQGLVHPQVVWTTAFGYQRYGMEGGVLTSVLNPTLGYQNFGLTNHKGIVVGNQYTGEKTTKVGFSLDIQLNNGLQIGDNNDDYTAGSAGWVVTGNLTNAAINDNVEKAAYYYRSSLSRTLGDTDSNELVNEYNVTLDFVWDSDLSLFNHAVDVWYDCRGTTTETVSFSHDDNANANVNGSMTFPNNLTTYAVFDRAERTRVVTAPDAAMNGTVNTNNSVDSLAEAVLNAGFARRSGTDANKAFFNYAFAAMDGTNWDTDTAAGDSFSGPSPIIANNGEDSYADVTTDTQANTDTHPLYLVISNTQGNVVDVVISLDMTLSKVVQDNNTQTPLSTGIITENDSVGDTTTYRYFDTWDQISLVNGEDYSNIADQNRVDSYDAKLGDYVAAVAITGTTGGNTPGPHTGVTSGVATATDGWAKAAGANPTGTNTANMTSTYYYQMSKLEKTVTGTMVMFDQVNDTVHVQVGGEVKVYPRSVFALATDGSFQSSEHVWAPRATGTYTFYLDANDNWLFWEQGSKSAEFVYGTYIDYGSQLASGLFTYPMVYVTANGEQKQQVNIEELDMNGYTDANHTPAFDGDMSNVGYTKIQLPKRTNVADNSAGFVPGVYVGYKLSGNSIDADLEGTGFHQAGTNAYSTWGTWNDFGADGTTTTIDTNSVAIGAEPVGGEGNLFLTERTKFIIVDGAGVPTQTATVYNGISDLLGSHETVTIDASSAYPISTYLVALNATSAATNPMPYQMVYYSLEQEPYAQDYDTADKFIDTVFIPAEFIDSTDPVNGNLFFVGDNTFGLIDAANNATQYTFYQNGVESVRWITGLPAADYTSGALIGQFTDAKIITQFGPNVFYQLHDTGSKAVNGEPIYELIQFTQTDANNSIIGQYYGIDGTRTTATAARAGVSNTTIMANANNTTGYLATTRNSQVAYIGGRTNNFLWNVANANVLDLNDDFTINSLGDLNDQSSLTSNQGVNVSCVRGDTDTTISFIYVNY